MYYAFYRTRLGEWEALGSGELLSDAQVLVETQVALLNLACVLIWHGVVYVCQTNKKDVLGVVTIAPITEQELAERYPKVNPPVIPPGNPPRRFLTRLTGKQRQELAFAENYMANFAHGTADHDRLELIAKLAALLDTEEAR